MKEFDYEFLTYVKIENGFAPIGIKEKFNIGGTIDSYEYKNGKADITLSDGGTFIAYCQKKPVRILVNSTENQFSFSDNLLSVGLPLSEKNFVEIIW